MVSLAAPAIGRRLRTSDVQGGNDFWRLSLPLPWPPCLTMRLAAFSRHPTLRPGDDGLALAPRLAGPTAQCRAHRRCADIGTYQLRAPIVHFEPASRYGRHQARHAQPLAVENGLHWGVDVAMHRDHTHIRIGHTAGISS